MNRLTMDRQKAQADALFSSIGDGAIATDEEGNIARINQKALDILGLKEEDVIGQWFPGVVVATDENGNMIEPIDRAIIRAILTGKPVSERAFYMGTGGQTIPVSVTVSPIILNGQPTGTIEVFRDISAELEIERLKSEFISIASHQLRTPATAVKNFIGLLREGYAGELTKEQADLVEMAYISNENQLEIVNNLLYTARADSSEVKLKLTPVNMPELVVQCISEQQVSFDDRKQHLHTDLPEQPVVLTMDRQFIRMLIENLLSNASKYTPDGGKITIALENTGRSAVLRVADTGVGIAGADRQKLFQRFSRIDNELSTVRGGSGIGLYLVKRIADLHHGHIRVASSPGKGSTFTVKLPKEQPNG